MFLLNYFFHYVGATREILRVAYKLKQLASYIVLSAYVEVDPSLVVKYVPSDAESSVITLSFHFTFTFCIVN